MQGDHAAGSVPLQAAHCSPSDDGDGDDDDDEVRDKSATLSW